MTHPSDERGLALIGVLLILVENAEGADVLVDESTIGGNAEVTTTARPAAASTK